MPDVIAVIGMGRSGTALACQVLEALGVFFGKPEHLVGPTEFNARGHYDHGPIHNLNIELLERVFNVNWLFLGELPVGWEHWESVAPYRTKAVEILREEAACTRGAPLGIKDPRITRMRGFWEIAFEEANLNPSYVLCWRHPEHVYLSCHPRTLRVPSEKDPGQVETVNFFNAPEHPTARREDMYAIWAHYMTAGFETNPEVVLKYENWFLRGWAEKQAAALAALVDARALTSEHLDEIIDPEMKHHG